MKADLETILDEIETFAKANLNTRIAAIEAEKVAGGKGITGGLAPIADEAYYCQSWDDKILSFSPAIFYGVENIAAEGIGPATKETFTIFVEIVIVDSGNDLFTRQRINRYSRALKEIFQENYDRFGWGARIKIETVRPVSFKLDLDSSEEIKVGGISITTALA